MAETKIRKSIEVVAAVIKKNQEIFATQRGYGDFKGGWEFPGGKFEPGESLHRALARELVEELGIHPLLLDVIMTERVQAPDCEIELYFVRAFTRENEEPQPREGQLIRWVSPENIKKVPLLPSDRSFVQYFEKIFYF